MRDNFKKLLFRVLGKDPEGVVVSFASGDPALGERMFAEIQELVPDRRHFLVRPEELSPGSTLGLYRQLRKRFRKFRIGLAPVLFTNDRRYRAWRLAAFLLAPAKILAYNARLERHHLRLRTAIASLLFLRGVALDRIFLRPSWLVPWKKDRSVYPTECEEFAGRPIGSRKHVAVLTPYSPYPLSHGGAVRIFHLLREMARDFDIFLLAFRDRETAEDLAPVLELCARVVLVGKPRYREPRWSTMWPPEAHEFQAPAMQGALERIRREYGIDVIQVEYTFLAPYRGDVLVEHDVTFELHRQVYERNRNFSNWWNYWRWRRFETKWAAQYKKVVVMSERDRAVLAAPNAVVVPNGVDLESFAPEIERLGQRLLFIGSFRHFPNVVAFRFLLERVWPLVRRDLSDATITIVAGPDPLLYWREYTGQRELPSNERITLHSFVADVRPLYVESNLALVPTLVSAGTNLKVLEAMAMDRAVVSTPSGCQGLGLVHGVNVWIAESAESFAAGIRTLLLDRALRQRIAAAGRVHAEQNFGWKQIGSRQRALVRDLINQRHLAIRRAAPEEIPQIFAIQATAPESSQWQPADYLTYDCHLAVLDERLAGFLVSRRVAEGEREILNVAVHPEFRRTGVATELIRAELARWPGVHFLEVRESNTAARKLYELLGFQQVGVRAEYYENPPETGIVMRIFS